MDYPKSVPSVGLVNGKFVDENPVTGTPGSLIPAAWGNGVTQEILNVLAAAGIAPDETKTDQLAQALSVLSDWLKLKNKPTTLAGYGITDAMPAGAGGLLTIPAVVKGNSSELTSTQFVTLADATTDRPDAVRYGAGLHIKYPDGKYGFDLLAGITGEWFGVRRVADDGKGTWRMLWHDGNFNPAAKADKATSLAGYGITDALLVGGTSRQRPSLSAQALGESGNGVGGALEIREAQEVTNTQTGFDYAPRILFHWAGLIARSLAMNSAGELMWGSQTAWTSGNFDPARKANVATTLAGYGITDALSASSFLKPVAGQWIQIGGSGVLPAGGTWAFFCANYNGNGAALGGNAGVAAGGTAVGNGNCVGFAWRIQ